LQLICLTYINDRFAGTYESTLFGPYRNQLSDHVRLAALDSAPQQTGPRRDPLTLHPLQPLGVHVLVAMHIPQCRRLGAQAAPARLGSGSVALPLVCVDRTPVLRAHASTRQSRFGALDAPTLCPQLGDVSLLWIHSQITSG
jgi:hypothetical protein